MNGVGQSAYECWLSLGNTGTEADFIASLKGADGATGPQGETGLSGGFLFPTMNFDPDTGELTIRGLAQEIDRVYYDEATAELVVRL